MTSKNHKKIYMAIATLIDRCMLKREEVITSVANALTGGNCKGDECYIGDVSLLRGEIGTVLDEMVENELISESKTGFRLVNDKPIILRAEACERELLAALRNGPRSRAGLRQILVDKFGTANTLTKRDDDILYSLIGKVTKRLLNIGVIEFANNVYSIAPGKSARIDDINAILTVKEEFLTKLHARGGEFFEHYFMSLLAKYLSKNGKTVLTNKVLGGSNDGGIDGIIETRDVLGFKETIMVQMKNRIEDTSETTVRGFWGSVCAYGGSRGIFATSSGFHTSAKEFLDGIDNCIGIDSDMLFKMACECLYGVKKKDGKYTVDTRVI